MGEQQRNVPAEWLKDEWEKIDQRRDKAFGDQREKRNDNNQEPEDLVGVTLSGGGIRSALFNDGFLQGLSHRGFLRYVDYLSSVSGGGYIAGHLVSLARSKKSQGRSDSNDQSAEADNGKYPSAVASSESAENASQPNQDKGFHDDRNRWTLGRDPRTGQVDESRLQGVGGYLSRPLELLPAYLISFIFSAAFYIGLGGVLATLIAMAWRTFDAPIFRVIYLQFLSIRIGNELLIAFIPAILWALAILMGDLFLFSMRIFPRFRGETWQLRQRRFRQIGLVTFGMGLLFSLAIFLGNGTTNIHANASSSILLNHYAQWLAVIAGVLQILVLFGSERLLLSERAEAKSWHGHFQRVITTGILLFIGFAFVHWMGREDISKFTSSRDPYLVIGDVTDWETMSKVFSPTEKKPAPGWGHEFAMKIKLALGPVLGVKGKQWLFERKNAVSWIPSPKELASPQIRPSSDWERTLATRRWETSSGIDSAEINEVFRQPNVDDQPLLLGRRIWLAAGAYYYSLSDPEDPTSTLGADAVKKRSQSGDFYIPDSSDEDIVENPNDRRALNNPRYAYAQIKRMRAVQRGQLLAWNKEMKKFSFTERLIGLILLGEEKSNFADLMKRFSQNKELHKRIEELPLRDRKRLVTLVNNGVPGKESVKVWPEDWASVNRVLLELGFPSAILQKDIPSTFVVPPHDQRARKSWLVFWLGLTVLGSVSQLLFPRNASIFKFYRRQLGMNFLTGQSGHKTRLCELEPTADGLPYPLMLAASLESVRINGRYKVQVEPFVFTPKDSGEFLNDCNRFGSKQVSLRKFFDKPMTLGDAVTLSGAALSPLMTRNRVLSVMVDFFRTDMGGLVYRKESTGVDEGQDRTWLYLGLFFASAVFAGLIAYVCGLPAGILAFVLGASVSGSIGLEIGIPHFLKTLLFPRDLVGGAHDNSNQQSRKSFYVADGGFRDYLGVSELLTRRCRLIVVSDAGAGRGDDKLGALASMCEKMTAEHGVRFLDLDHEAPIDFGRLEMNEQRLIHQPYVCYRYRYPDGSEGLMFYCQMAISDRDPIEIQQIRQRFPTFPDEPTVNQFYTDEQVAAYRLLGYHIANRFCLELERWDYQHKVPDSCRHDSSENTSKHLKPFHDALWQCDESLNSRNRQQPYFDIVEQRLLTSYRLACYEEISYNEEDILSEAIWPVSKLAFPQLHSSVNRWLERSSVSSQARDEDHTVLVASDFLAVAEQSADVRSAYRKAVLEDINRLQSTGWSHCGELWRYMWKVYLIHKRKSDAGENNILNPDANDCTMSDHQMLTSYLVVIATACQEIHRGRPHAAFQIGGRLKLIELCLSIAKVMIELDERPSASKPNTTKMSDELSRRLDQTITEVLEIQRSVFQGGERVTSVSFIQCLMFFWGQRIGYRHALQSVETKIHPPVHDPIERTLEEFLGDLPEADITAHESSVIESRRRLDRGLRRLRMPMVIDAMKTLWLMGYASTAPASSLGDAGEGRGSEGKGGGGNSGGGNSGSSEQAPSKVSSGKRQGRQS